MAKKKPVFSLEPKDHPLYDDTYLKISKWIDIFDLSSKTVEIDVQILNVDNRFSRALVKGDLVQKGKDFIYFNNITLYEPIAEITIMHELAHIKSSFYTRSWWGNYSRVMDWSKLPEINSYLRGDMFYLYVSLQEFVVEAYTQNLIAEMVEKKDDVESFLGQTLADYPDKLYSHLDEVPEAHFRSLHLVLWNFLIGSWNQLFCLYNYSILSCSKIFKEYFDSQRVDRSYPIGASDIRKKLADQFAENVPIDIESYSDYANLFCSFINIMARAQTGNFGHAVSFDGEKITMEPPLYECLMKLNNCYNEMEKKYSNHNFEDDLTKIVTPGNIQSMDVTSIANMIASQYESDELKTDLLTSILVVKVGEQIQEMGLHQRVKLTS